MNTETDNELNPTSEANATELERLMSIDSANMPTSMAVNQEALQMAASSDIELPRSLYYGVYHVKPEGKHFDEFKFRSAIRLGNGKGATWVALGYFNCEHTAAMAYNVAAVNYFGKGAWLNPVDTAKADPAEYAAWRETRAEYIVKATQAIHEIKKSGGELQYVDLEANRQQTLARANGES